MEKKIDRKEFFKKGFISILKPITKAVEDKLDGFRTGLLRPPGALEELAFIAACTKCDLCKDACPFEAIQLAASSYGVAARTPYIDPMLTACQLCEDLPCIKVCEPGALKEVKREDVRMGLAEINESTCLAWRGIMCESCYASCPFPAEAITMDGLSRPKIIVERCTGCGICANVCIAKPSSIRIIPS